MDRVTVRPPEGLSTRFETPPLHSETVSESKSRGSVSSVQRPTRYTTIDPAVNAPRSRPFATNHWELWAITRITVGSDAIPPDTGCAAAEDRGKS